MHAGTTAELAKAKGEAITAWSALTGRATVSANEAVLGMLQMSWLRVDLYAGLLQEQVLAAQEQRSDHEGGEGYGAGGVGAGAGLVGHTRSAVKDVGIFASGEAVRALAQLEAQERDRCVRYAKTTHDMGIAEQEVALVKQQAELLADTVRRICDSLLWEVLAVLEQAEPEAAASTIRAAWPRWMGEIAPREFRATPIAS